jgi:signal transduction histidine kinase
MSPAVSALTSVPRRAHLFSLRDRPVRTKLVAALLVPTVAFLVTACLSAASSVARANGYQDGVSLATLGRDVTATVHELQLERDIAAGYVGNDRQPLGPDERPRSGPKPGQRLATQQRTVDVAVAGFRGALGRTRGDLPTSTRDLAATAEQALDGLPALRATVRGQGLPAGAISDQYTSTIADLLALDGQIGRASGDENIRQQVTALNDVSNLTELSSQVRGELYAVAFAGRFEFRQGQSLSSLLARQDAAEDRFRADADLTERTLYEQVVNGQAVLAVSRIESTAIDRANHSSLDVDPQQWYNASTTRIELLRTVEERLLNSVITESSSLRDDAWRQVAFTGAGIVLILVLAFTLSLIIANSMADPLRRLRTNALEVAHTRLPRLIEELRTAEGEPAQIRIEPVGIDSRDEIGEVARTVDELQYEAVRLAAEQATLRRGVNTMFLNLSRRSQALIERQLSLIDQLEAAEQDPSQLENLFKLDHLATRMRRNSENLLVLAGAGMGRRRARPVSLSDVLRAAIGEIEQFERVEILSVPNVEVASQAVNHVVHLVAELLENAAQFSPPHSAVSLSAYSLADGGALIKIEDAGMGMSDSEIAAANRRLAEAPIFDFSIAQRMGLFVVARLASRHKVRVRLQRSSAGGVTGMIDLPAMLLASPRVPAQNRLGSGGLGSAGAGSAGAGSAGAVPGPRQTPSAANGSAPAIGGIADQVAGHDGAFALDPDATVTPAPSPRAAAPDRVAGSATSPEPRDVDALPPLTGPAPSAASSPAAMPIAEGGGTGSTAWFAATEAARARSSRSGEGLDRRSPGAAAAAASAPGPVRGGGSDDRAGPNGTYSDDPYSDDAYGYPDENAYGGGTYPDRAHGDGDYADSTGARYANGAGADPVVAWGDDGDANAGHPPAGHGAAVDPEGTIFTSLTDLYGLGGADATAEAERASQANWSEAPSRSGVPDWDATGPEPTRAADARFTDPRLADRRAGDPRVADPRLAEQRMSEQRWPGPRLSDPRPAGPGRSDPRPADPRLADPRLADPADTGPLSVDPRADAARPSGDDRRLTELRQMREARRLHETRPGIETTSHDLRRPDPRGEERLRAAEAARAWESRRALDARRPPYDASRPSAADRSGPEPRQSSGLPSSGPQPSGPQPRPAPRPRPTASAEWERRSTRSEPEPAGQLPTPAAPATGEESVWAAHSDPGWQAAVSAQTPVPGGITPTGLPIRVPRAQLVPGQTEDPWADAPKNTVAPPQPEQVRGRLSSLYEGVQRAREVADPYRDDFDGRRS